MAGDWIKMRADLHTHPKVVRMASALNADRLRVVGGLHAVWCLFDAHSEDGSLSGYTLQAVDELIGFTGFAQALCGVKWLENEPDGLLLPEFDEHNGQSAKRRATETKRKRQEREEEAAAEADRKLSASGADIKRTREEKRREEKKSPSLRSGEDAGKPATRKRREDTNLKTYLETCKQAGERPLPADHPIRDYCADAHITDEMLQLAWIVFKDRFTTGKDKAKRQKDWPAHFANSVRGRWANLWHTTEKGETCWTSVGLQERAVAEARMKPQQGDSA